MPRQDAIVVSGARGALKSQGLEAPFVGRDRELRQIKDLFHRAADERRAHLVSVTGIVQRAGAVTRQQRTRFRISPRSGVVCDAPPEALTPGHDAPV